ncbi:hypothetical protein [Staphylococcus pseudintermedius]|uniref:hypothetical protein n=1 Tax=Staphylococcus pseudintermedius TaxID=283734 RepID=UPI00286DCF2A|nr:hypothetical protein [Staphylococcus pseudintermedius]WMZ88794.1 hypothetical protein QS436_13070 [Staphylococcus pseudintermedius]
MAAQQEKVQARLYQRVDTNVLAPSLVVLPFDASLLNELTADTNSLASVLTASLVRLDKN